MKIFKKYILPFLILYSGLSIAVAGIVYWMTVNGYAPIVLSEFQFVLAFMSLLLVSVISCVLLLNHNKNIKAVYANVSKRPLLIVCIGEALYGVNALMATIFDGLVLGSLIVIFPLLLFVMKTTRDIKESLT